jgi:hypothetical protein
VGPGHSAACIFAEVATAERPPKTLGIDARPAAEKVEGVA